jgi:hypothetical protein
MFAALRGASVNLNPMSGYGTLIPLNSFVVGNPEANYYGVNFRMRRNTGVEPLSDGVSELF